MSHAASDPVYPPILSPVLTRSGRGGSKITEIRRLSGSRISIAKVPHDESGERMFTIVGTPESTERALMLLYSQVGFDFPYSSHSSRSARVREGATSQLWWRRRRSRLSPSANSRFPPDLSQIILSPFARLVFLPSVFLNLNMITTTLCLTLRPLLSAFTYLVTRAEIDRAPEPSPPTRSFDPRRCCARRPNHIT